MPRALDLRLDSIKLAQNGRVLTATAVAPQLNFVTTELIRDLDRLTAAVDTDDTVVLTVACPAASSSSPIGRPRCDRRGRRPD